MKKFKGVLLSFSVVLLLFLSAFVIGVTWQSGTAQFLEVHDQRVLLVLRIVATTTVLWSWTLYFRFTLPKAKRLRFWVRTVSVLLAGAFLISPPHTNAGDTTEDISRACSPSVPFTMPITWAHQFMCEDLRTRAEIATRYRDQGKSKDEVLYAITAGNPNMEDFVVLLNTGPGALERLERVIGFVFYPFYKDVSPQDMGGCVYTRCIMGGVYGKGRDLTKSRRSHRDRRQFFFVYWGRQENPAVCGWNELAQVRYVRPVGAPCQHSCHGAAREIPRGLPACAAGTADRSREKTGRPTLFLFLVGERHPLIFWFK